MISATQDKQLSLAADGRVHWQKDPTNPLTGPAIGRILKGQTMLEPVFELGIADLLESADQASVTEIVQGWLTRHVQTVLDPLFLLVKEEGIDGPAKEIAQKVFDALGIIPREDIHDHIALLEESGRSVLRSRKLRMGPLLVYLPDLNKPAAVKLRALLWTLWQDGELPAMTPTDGIVSFNVRDKQVDEAYYRAIGYPVFGPRAIRVDMLDRVVCAVYDNAKDGKFQAQHKMAEWLGSNISDLYDVLTAMGHTKIHDPLEEKIKADADVSAPAITEEQLEVSTQSSSEISTDPVENISSPEESQSPAAPAEEAVTKAAPARPELATFRLKRGKAAGKAQEKPRERKEKSKEPKVFVKKDKPSQSSSGESDNKKFKGKKPRPHGKDKDRDDREDRIYSAAASKVEDSPFAILQQLKLGTDSKK